MITVRPAVSTVGRLDFSFILRITIEVKVSMGEGGAGSNTQGITGEAKSFIVGRSFSFVL